MQDSVLHKTDQFGRPDGGQELIFFCPGCKCAHGVLVTHEPKWGWNGSMETPTFTPSIKTEWTDFTEKGWKDYEAWCAAEHPKSTPSQFENKKILCHSFVTDGNIQFLDDCTHELKGQTVPLAPF